jgi:hypothetical protein
VGGGRCVVRRLEALRARCVLAACSGGVCLQRGEQTRVWRRFVEENGLRTFGTGCYYEPVLKVPFSTGS